MKERISAGIEEWLDEEVRQSNAGRNQVLDDYDEARRSYQMAFDDPANKDASKARSHYDRFKVLVDNLDPELLTYPRLPAKLIHHSLMFVSGGFRLQCFLQAGSQEEYEMRRFDSGRSSGIDVSEAVAVALGSRLPSAKDGVERIAAYSMQALDTMMIQHRSIYDWFGADPSRVGKAVDEHESPVQAILSRQKTAISLAVSHIAVAAECFGSLEQVPVLEPKSITDVSRTPIHPFAA